MLFNKPSDMTYREWMDSDAKYLLNQIPKDVVEWVYEVDMTDEEKEQHPTYEATGGYLKVLNECVWNRRCRCWYLHWMKKTASSMQYMANLSELRLLYK